MTMPPMESFFHTLKTALVYQRHYATRAEATRDILAYIEDRHRLYQPDRDGAKSSLTLSIFSGEDHLLRTKLDPRGAPLRNSWVSLIVSRIGGITMRAEARGKPKSVRQDCRWFAHQAPISRRDQGPGPSGGGRVDDRNTAYRSPFRSDPDCQLVRPDRSLNRALDAGAEDRSRQSDRRISGEIACRHRGHSPSRLGQSRSRQR